MHTILRRDGKLHIGISTGGHYVSEDGGEKFHASNKGVGVGFAPDPYPEYGQCVHKIAGHKDAPGRLYIQNHGGFPDRPGIGVLRSDDHGATWRSIAKGLPSDFGFPIVVHPEDPDTVYVLPLEPQTRTCPSASPAVWRSENGGTSWKKLANGLPKLSGVPIAHHRAPQTAPSLRRLAAVIAEKTLGVPTRRMWD